jgi:hypothetical protein
MPPIGTLHLIKQLVVWPGPAGNTRSFNMALIVVLLPLDVRPTKTTWSTSRKG